MNKIRPIKYDVAVIGGGPAGIMAAGRAGELGARVVLLEKNSGLGYKLLITGNGRCNLTNKILDNRFLIDKYGQNGKFIYPGLNKFGVKQVIDFFESRGLKTKTEKGEYVFPASDKARDVLDVLMSYLKKYKVEVMTNAEVKEIIVKNKKALGVILKNGREIIAQNYIISTGGLSYPQTGSTGNGYDWLTKMGHTVNDLRPALTPVILHDKFIKDLEGLSLENIKISLFKNKKKIASCLGNAIFTADGLSGPAILDFSKQIGRVLPGDLFLKIDLLPGFDSGELDKKLQEKFTANKLLKNILCEFLPKRLLFILIAQSLISPDKKANSITKKERGDLIKLIKEFPLRIKSLAGYNKAMITSGGVCLHEIDPRTMKSRIIDNLYLAGELIDLDGPCGGFNLQICWSSGYLAGEQSALN